MIELLSLTFNRKTRGRRALNYVVRTTKNRSTLSERHSRSSAKRRGREEKERKGGGEKGKDGEEEEEKEGRSSNTHLARLPTSEKQFKVGRKNEEVDRCISSSRMYFQYKVVSTMYLSLFLNLRHSSHIGDLPLATSSSM